MLERIHAFHTDSDTANIGDEDGDDDDTQRSLEKNTFGTTASARQIVNIQTISHDLAGVVLVHRLKIIDFGRSFLTNGATQKRILIRQFSEYGII